MEKLYIEELRYIQLSNFLSINFLSINIKPAMARENVPAG